MLTCPRCEAILQEHEPNIEWNRHWVCPECCVAWKIEDGVLVQGSNRPFNWRERHETAAGKLGWQLNRGHGDGN